MSVAILAAESFGAVVGGVVAGVVTTGGGVGAVASGAEVDGVEAGEAAWAAVSPFGCLGRSFFEGEGLAGGDDGASALSVAGGATADFAGSAGAGVRTTASFFAG